MITIKQAAASALQYCVEVLGLSAEKVASLRIEEVDSDNSEWLITLSMPDPDDFIPKMLGKVPRVYKILAVDKESGDVKSMKIRSIQNA